MNELAFNQSVCSAYVLVILLYKVNTAIQYIPMTNISEAAVFLKIFKKTFPVIIRKSCPIRTCTLFGYE